MAYRRTANVEMRLADNRLRILSAARALVGEGGWPQAQVSHVAAAAGLATGTVYRYFPSKAHLCVEVLSSVSQREVDVLQAIADGPGTATARLHTAVTVFVTRAMRNRRLAYALIAEPCEPDIDQARLTYRHAISERIAQIVRAGQNVGDFRAQLVANTAATVIVGGFMEALIGPLSPLNADFGATSASNAPNTLNTPGDAVGQLAADIADLCCAAIATTTALARLQAVELPPQPQHPKRRPA